MRDTSGNVIITTTTTVPLNAWYRVEGYVTSNASTGQMEMKLFTSPGSTTPAETQTSSAAQDTAGGNLYQMRFGPSSAGVTGLTYYMDDVAMSTSGYVGPGPVVFHMACGAPSDAGFQVTSKPVGGTSLRLKVATNPGLTSNVTYVAAQAPGTYGYVSHAATGLAAGTLYYAQLADTPPGGTEALAGPVCQCHDPPRPRHRPRRSRWRSRRVSTAPTTSPHLLRRSPTGSAGHRTWRSSSATTTTPTPSRPLCRGSSASSRTSPCTG